MGDTPRDEDVPALGPFEPGLPGEARTGAEAIPEAYRRSFAIAGFAMNRFLIDHMLRATRLFENDAEAMILFGAVAHLNILHILPPGARPSETLDESGSALGKSPVALRPVRVRDLVLITGRPRETIRRRLERLEATGRLRRVVDGYVLNTDTVDETMREVTLDAVRRFVRTARVIEHALRDAEQHLSAQEREQR